MKLKLGLTLLALTMIIALQAQTADEILANHFKNTGGIEKWKALKTRKTEGKINFENMEFPMTALEKTPGKKHMLFQVQGQEIVQVYDGTDAWAINPFQGGKDPVKLSDEESKDFKDNELESGFIDYNSKGHSVELQGTEEIEGVKCHKIQLIKNKNNDKEDVTEIYFFDAENHVPIMIQSYARSGPAKRTEVKTYLSDYQEVDGLTMPFFIESKINGQTFQKITVEKVTLGEPIEDSVFTFPIK